MKNFVIVIPCRLDSRRFPEKLIQKYKQKEIFVHTYERCLKISPKENIYVLTDSNKISKICKYYKINYIVTKKNILTGSDRIASIKNKIKAKVYINVQGDEPIINPKDILKVINQAKKNNKIAINGYAPLKASEAKKKNIPKVILDRENNLIYMSRRSLPVNYSNKKNLKFFKQVCIYAYPRNLLKFFNNKKTYLEKYEDIEILRLIENSITVRMIRLSSNSFSIDLKKDLDKLKKRKFKKI